MTTNSNMKGFKFLISVKIQKIKLNISFPCDIIVLWKRGTQRIETKGKVSHNSKISLESTFNEELSMFAHFMFDESLNIFKEKKVKFQIYYVHYSCKIDIFFFVNFNTKRQENSWNNYNQYS